MSVIVWIETALALLVMIVAHAFVICALMFAATVLAGASVSRVIRWLNGRRIRLDLSPNVSRGWRS